MLFRSQTIVHCPLHDPRHRLPVQPVLPCCTLPTQFPGQAGYRLRQRPRDSRPRLGPRKVLHSYPATRTLYSMWLVTKNQPHLSHRQVPPFSLFPHAVHLPASLPANPTPQEPIPQTIDRDNHAIFAGFDFRYSMGFQAQLFSDKRLNEHLGSFPFLGLCGNNPKRIQDSRCLSLFLFQLIGFTQPQLQLHFSDRSRLC